jgi:hypothetical protein
MKKSVSSILILILIILNILQFIFPIKDVGTIMFQNSVSMANMSLENITLAENDKEKQEFYFKALAHLEFSSYSYNWSKYYKKNPNLDKSLKKLNNCFIEDSGKCELIIYYKELIEISNRLMMIPEDKKNEELINNLIEDIQNKS